MHLSLVVSVSKHLCFQSVKVSNEGDHTLVFPLYGGEILAHRRISTDHGILEHVQKRTAESQEGDTPSFCFFGFSMALPRRSVVAPQILLCECHLVRVMSIFVRHDIEDALDVKHPFVVLSKALRRINGG